MNNILKHRIKQFCLTRFGPDISFENIIGRNPALVSFDVFDTTITRAVGSPTGIFLHLQHRLANNALGLPGSLLADFPKIRLQAAREARKRSPAGRISLEEIHAEVARAFSLNPAQHKALIRMEIEEEFRHCCPVPGICELIKRLRDSGRQICFASDIYLERTTIQKLLEGCGVFDQRDLIFVSSQFGSSKKSGGLFKEILASTGVEARDILHIGDNMKGDYSAPRKLGIYSLLYQKTGLTRYEKSYLDHIQDPLLGQIVSGTARISRLQARGKSRPEKELFAIGSDLAGPVLVHYVLWILEKAHIQGLKRLYFFSRDGQILLQLAGKLKKLLNYDLELRYLHVSRQALNLPGVLRLQSHEVSWLFEKMDGLLTVRIMANRLNAGLEPIKKAVQQILDKEVGPDRELGPDEIELIRNNLFQSEMGRILQNKALESRRAVLSYFHQEGLTESIPSGVVDLGWKGSIQDLINKILQAENRTHPLKGFYFGLHTGKSDITKDKDSFLYSKQEVADFNRFKRLQFVMELLCSADHQTVISYAKDENRVEPVLKSGSCQWIFDWGLSSLRRGIFSYLNVLCKNKTIFENRPGTASCKQAFIHNIMSLIFHPSPVEASTLGRFLYTADTSETYLRELAPGFNLRQAGKFSRANWQGKRKHTFWHEGSFYRSPALVKLLLLITSVEIQKSMLFRIKNYTGSWHKNF